MADQTIDYDAIASKYGGKVLDEVPQEKPREIDYSSLSKYGAKIVDAVPAQKPREINYDLSKYGGSVVDNPSIPGMEQLGGVAPGPGPAAQPRIPRMEKSRLGMSPAEGLIETLTEPTSGVFQAYGGAKQVAKEVLPVIGHAQLRAMGQDKEAGPVPKVDWDKILSGGSDVIEGTFKAGKPAFIAAAATNPVTTLGTAVAAMAADKAGSSAATALGAPPELARFTGNVAALAAVGIGGKRILDKMDSAIAEHNRTAETLLGQERQRGEMKDRIDKVFQGESYPVTVKGVPAQVQYAGGTAWNIVGDDGKVLFGGKGRDVAEWLQSRGVRPVGNVPADLAAPEAITETAPKATIQTAPAEITVQSGSRYRTEKGEVTITNVDPKGRVRADRLRPDGSVEKLALPMRLFLKELTPSATPITTPVAQTPTPVAEATPEVPGQVPPSTSIVPQEVVPPVPSQVTPVQPPVLEEKTPELKFSPGQDVVFPFGGGKSIPPAAHGKVVEYSPEAKTVKVEVSGRQEWHDERAIVSAQPEIPPAPSRKEAIQTAQAVPEAEVGGTPQSSPESMVTPTQEKSSEVEPTASETPKAAAGEIDPNESVQDKSWREWGENFQRVSANPESATDKDLRRAIGFLDQRRRSIIRHAQEQGKTVDPNVLAGYDNEFDYYRTILAKRENGAAKPTTQSAPSNEAQKQEASAPKYEYGSTQANLPAKESDIIRSFGKSVAPEDLTPDGLETQPHVTVRYGNDETDHTRIAKALEGQGPITVKVKGLSLFPNVDTEHGKADVLKLDVDSPELRALNKKIGEAVPHPGETFPDYKPHVTVAYLKAGTGKKYVAKGIPGLTGKTITLDSVAFSGKDDKQVEIPLSGASNPVEKREAASHKPLTRKERRAAEIQHRKDIYTPGNVITGYGGQQDKVLAYEEGVDSLGMKDPGAFRVQVQSVGKDGQPDGRPRWHSTPPDRNAKVVSRGELEPVDVEGAKRKPLKQDTPSKELAPSIKQEISAVVRGEYPKHWELVSPEKDEFGSWRILDKNKKKFGQPEQIGWGKTKEEAIASALRGMYYKLHLASGGGMFDQMPWEVPEHPKDEHYEPGPEGADADYMEELGFDDAAEGMANPETAEKSFKELIKNDDGHLSPAVDTPQGQVRKPTKEMFAAYLKGVQRGHYYRQNGELPEAAAIDIEPESATSEVRPQRRLESVDIEGAKPKVDAEAHRVHEFDRAVEGRRGERETADRTIIQKAERDIISAASEKVPNGRTFSKDVEARVRKTKESFPTTGEMAFQPLTVRKVSAKTKKNGDIIPEIEYKNIPYSYDSAVKGKPLWKTTSLTPEGEDVSKQMADAIFDEVVKVRKDAQAAKKDIAKGKAPNATAMTAVKIDSQRDWYNRMRTILRKEFGSAGDLFADLLGATSAQTPVATNWKQAVEALERVTKGHYEKIIPPYKEFRQAGGDATKYTGERALRYGDANYNANTLAVMDVLSWLWRGKPGAPKTQNYAGNLIGAGDEATVDVWAARMLQRIRNQVIGDAPMIPPPAEVGVRGEVSPSGQTTGQFMFGQKVFAKAAKRFGMKPHELQAFLWFAEKDLWTRKGLTSAVGEGGDMASSAAKEGLGRMTAGIEPQDSAKPQNAVAMMKPVADVAKEIPAVKAIVNTPARGMWSAPGGDAADSVVWSSNFEVTFKRDDPTAVSRIAVEVFKAAKANKQDDAFVARTIANDDDDSAAHARPALSVYFRNPLDEEEAWKIVQSVKTDNIGGFTLFSGPELGPGKFRGMRFVYMPEYVHDPAKIISMGVSKADTLVEEGRVAAIKDMGAIVKSLGGDARIGHALMEFLEVLNGSKENYDDLIAQLEPAKAPENGSGSEGAIAGAAQGSGAWGTPIGASVRARALARVRAGSGETPGADGQSAEEKGLEQVDVEGNRPVPGFFSQLQRTIEAKMPEKASPGQVANIINNPQSGVKPDEIKWTDLGGWLSRQKGPITKQQVLDYLKQNEVKVEEVEKGATVGEIAWKTEKDGWMGKVGGVEFEITRTQFTPKELKLVAGGHLPEYHVEDVSANLPVGDFETLEEAKAAASNYRTTPTKFSQYTLPGGQNYRELLLTLPMKPITKPVPGSWKVIAPKMKGPDGRSDSNTFRVFDGNDLIAYGESFDDAINQALVDTDRGGQVSYKSGHWDEPNALAHIRFNDRTGPNEEKILHVEEIQSDWGQQIRKDAGSGKTPAMPFPKTWPELAFRRALRYAAENGYDTMTWATGSQQNDRYDLSKQIDSIWAKKVGDDKYEVTVTGKDGEDQIYDTGRTGPISADKIEDLVGKDMAQKIVDHGEKSKAPIDLRGLDLKVEGQGMKGFYDQILPAYANRYAKRWGAKVGETKINAGSSSNEFTVSYKNGYDDNDGFDVSENGSAEQPIAYFDTEAEANEFLKGLAAKHETVHSIQITPEMRKSVMEGQPLFYAPPKIPKLDGPDRTDPYVSRAPLSFHLAHAEIKPIPLNGRAAGIADAFVVSPSAMELVGRAAGRAADQTGPSYAGMHLAPKDAAALARNLKIVTKGDLGKAEPLHRALEAAGKSGKSLILVSDHPEFEKHQSDALTEEIGHAHQAQMTGKTKAHLGGSLGSFTASPVYQRAAESLRSGGYGDVEAGSGQEAAEVGVRLMRPDGYKELGLTVPEARQLAAEYVRALRREHGSRKPKQIAEEVFGAFGRGDKEGAGQLGTVPDRVGPERPEGTRDSARPDLSGSRPAKGTPDERQPRAGGEETDEIHSPAVVAIESKGQGGVRRFVYRNEDGSLVGNARLMGTTIGDIEVNKNVRRQGYGISILRDLQSKGGRAAYAGSDGGAALMRKAGMVEHAPLEFRFPDMEGHQPAKRLSDRSWEELAQHADKSKPEEVLAGYPAYAEALDAAAEEGLIPADEVEFANELAAEKSADSSAALKNLVQSLLRDAQKNAPPPPVQKPLTATQKLQKQLMRLFRGGEPEPTIPDEVKPDWIRKVEEEVNRKPPTAAEEAAPKNAHTETTEEFPHQIKESRLAKRIEERALADGMSEEFEGRPRYKTVNVKEQAKLAADLINSNLEEAISVAMGNSAPPPNGLIAESVLVAVENYAVASGDAELMRRLSVESEISLEATKKGQDIRMLRERNPDSPITAMREVAAEREAVAKRRYGPKAKEKLKAKAKEAIKTANKQKGPWVAFIESVKC